MTEAPELREMDDPEGMAIHNATPVDAIDGFLDRDLEAAFQAAERRWGWDEAMDHLARMVLRQRVRRNWITIDG